MTEVVSGDNWSYKSCKAPVKMSPPTNQHPVYLQARCPCCRPTNSVRALKGICTSVTKEYNLILTKMAVLSLSLPFF